MSKHNEYFDNDGNFDTAIVFVHGILGSPNQFNDFVAVAKGRVAIYNLLLPGHGKTGKDFAQSNMAVWQKYVDDKVNDVQSRHEKIILVGHSLGCLLLAQTALTSPDKICRLLFLAPPLKIRMRLRCILNSVKIAFNFVKDDDFMLQNSIDLYGVEQKNPFGYIRFIPRFVELLAKCRKTRKIIPLLNVPILAVFSEYDEMVSPKSAKFLVANPIAKISMLKNSGHFYYDDLDQQFILNSLNNILAELE
ncbi:MAG: alpha/beta hydrolase [Clostridia bacterium]